MKERNDWEGWKQITINMIIMMSNDAWGDDDDDDDGENDDTDCNRRSARRGLIWTQALGVYHKVLQLHKQRKWHIQVMTLISVCLDKRIKMIW